MDIKTKTINNVITPYCICFYEEIYNAMKFGYKFEILRGYTF